MKNTQDFLERLINDENFAEEFGKIEDFEALKEKAKKEGYDISKEEFEKLQAEANSELSDEELESASGGVSKASVKKFFKDFAEGFKIGFTGAAKVVTNVVGLLTGKK